MDIEDIEVFIGIGRRPRIEHWATALSRKGRKVFDRALPNDEECLRALYEKLADHGNLLVVVDQPAIWRWRWLGHGHRRRLAEF